MQIHQIVIEQENITNAAQFRNAFTDTEWHKIVCGLATEIVSNNSGGFIQTDGEDYTRNMYNRIHTNLGPGLPSSMTPVNWKIRAQSLRILFPATNPSWQDIIDFLDTYKSNPGTDPGCEIGTGINTTRGDPTPHTPENRTQLLTELTSDLRATVTTPQELSSYMSTYLERLSQAGDRAEEDFQRQTWYNRIMYNSGNNDLIQFWTNIYLGFIENPQENIENYRLKQPVSKQDLNEQLWRFTLAADRLVASTRQAARTD